MMIAQDTVRREMLFARDGEGTLALPLLVNLLRYGKEYSDVTILEGILDAEWYKPLFETAILEFGNNIFAYYYDLPFEETLIRHITKPCHSEFGEIEMRRWWKEKDYISIIPEKIISKDVSLSDTVEMIYNDVGTNCTKLQEI